jgi:hypothetical protein
MGGRASVRQRPPGQIRDAVDRERDLVPEPQRLPVGPAAPRPAARRGGEVLLGIRLAEARSTALFQPATELRAAVLARTLGIDITVAVKWQRAAVGDWTAYAVEVSRRTPVTTRNSGRQRPS